MADLPCDIDRHNTRKRAAHPSLVIEISDDEDHDVNQAFLGRIQQSDEYTEERRILSRGVRRILNHLRHKRLREAEEVANTPLDSALLEPAATSSLAGFTAQVQSPPQPSALQP